MTTEVSLAHADSKLADAHTRFLNTKFFGSLNGVRAVCCLLVIKSHADWNTGVRILDQGSLGVEVFFVISGFLIVTLLIREQERTGTIDLGKFYIRRSLRIFPIYYAIILLVLAASLVLMAVHKPNMFHYYRWGFLVLLTYTQDLLRVRVGTFRPCWSLAVEEQFYLVWPSVEKYFSPLARWITLAGVVIISELVNYRIFDGFLQRIYHDPLASLEPLFIVTFAPIAFGVCFAHWLHHPRSFRYAYQILGYRWSPIALLTVLAVMFQFSPADLSGTPRLAIHILITLLLGSLVIREDHFFARILKIPLLAEVGAISYGLYLYHQWIMDYTHPLVNRIVSMAGLSAHLAMIRFVFVSILGILVAKVSFKYFEEPIIRLRTRYQS